MNSEKRFFLAVAISFLILLLYPIYLRWVSPPPTPNNRSGVDSSSIQEQANLGEQAASSSPAAMITTQQSKPTENFYKFSNEHFDVEFSDLGGTITKLKLKEWGKGREEVVLIESAGPERAFSADLANQGLGFSGKVFSPEVLNEQSGEVRFTAMEPGKWRLAKKYQFSRDGPTIQLEVEVQNLSAEAQTAVFELTTQLAVGSEHGRDRYYTESFTAFRDKVVAVQLGKLEKKPSVQEGEILWAALAKKYFALIIRPDRSAALSKTDIARNGAEAIQSALRFAPEAVAPGGSIQRQFLVYAGPQYYRSLKSFGYGFEQILSSGFFGIFKLWLLAALQWTHKAVGNYGWAIILITIAIKLLFTPLTHISFESMKKMQALQPKLKALQERYKNDQAKLSQEMMGLYKRNKVNPMAGCLPMLLQIPIFIAFYSVLAQTVELKGEPFIFWIQDLSAPDRLWTLPMSLPIIGSGINILPLLMLGSMLWQQHLTPQTGTPEQQKMMMIMPIVFGFVFYNLPSGLVLYWFVNNLLSIFHQLFIKGKALPHHEEETKS